MEATRRTSSGQQEWAHPIVNKVTTYGYDAADELTTVGYSDPTTPNLSYGYDALGRRTSMTDGTAASSYQFDSLGRLTKHTDGAGKVVAYGYDLNGQATSLTYPGAQVVNRTFDDAGRLIAAIAAMVTVSDATLERP